MTAACYPLTHAYKLCGCFRHDSEGDPPAKRPCVAPPDATVHAAVYEWCLDRIDPEQPLFHTSYFGQVVRTGVTAEQAFDTRTREHRADATRDPKDLGLHWAIRTFGPDAFTVRIVHTARLPRRDAMEWANRRETELIAAHGGVMIDREPDAPIRQTFNLTRGGQGDPTVVWQSIEARSELMWRRIQPYLQAFYDEHGHLRVPRNYESPDGFKLGQLVSSIRSQDVYVKGHPDRLAWLKERGWVANERDAMWEDAQAYLQEYYDDPKHGHLRVPKTYVSPDGFKLGQLVNRIRSKDVYVKGHPDRLAWLKERGWVAKERDAMWEDVQPYLQEYYDDPKHGHLRVPRSYVSPDGFKLGKLVNSIRSKDVYVKGHPDRTAWLKERGWVANECDAKWEDVQAYLQEFYDDPKHGHLRVSQGYASPDGFKLGQLVSSIRSQNAYVKGHPDRIAWLKGRGFKMHARDPVKDAERWAALDATCVDPRRL